MELNSLMTKEKDSNNLLLVAASEGNISDANYWLDKGADIHAWDERPLRVAALYGRKDMVLFLISRGACFARALGWAATLGDVGTTARLMELNPGSKTEIALRAAFDHLAKPGTKMAVSRLSPLASPRFVGPVVGVPVPKT